MLFNMVAATEDQHKLLPDLIPNIKFIHKIFVYNRSNIYTIRVDMS